MKKSVRNKSKVGIRTRIKNIYNESPVHAAFSYPFVFTFFLIVFSVIIELSFEKLGFNPRNFISYFLGTLFFLIPIWVLTGLFVSKRKIPFLLSIIIGSAIIYIPHFIQEGYANAARKAATKTIHAQTLKTIGANIRACMINDDEYSPDLDCSDYNSSKIIDFIITKNLDRNPFNTTYNAVRPSASNTNDDDVGYVSLSSSGSNIIIKSCNKTPCKKEENRKQSSVSIK